MSSMDAMNQKRRATVNEIREFAAEQAELRSIRRVALDIGVGHSTLANFLNGASPHPRIKRLLYEWFEGERRAEGPNVEEAQPLGHGAALSALVGDLPVRYRRFARSVLLGALAGAYRAAGMEPPPWTKEEG